MKQTSLRLGSLLFVSALALGATACASKGAPAQGAGDSAASGGDSSGTSGSTSSSDTSGGSADAGGGAKTDAGGGAASGGGDGAKAAAENSKKEANAVVLEFEIKTKGDATLDAASKSAIESAMNDRIKASTKVASSAAGIATPRPVLGTLLVSKPTMGKDGLSAEIGFVGVSKDGRCPLFDVKQHAAISDGKIDNAADVAELRKAVVTALFDKFEESAPNLKPNANCTVQKK